MLYTLTANSNLSFYYFRSVSWLIEQLISSIVFVDRMESSGPAKVPL